MNQKVPVTLVLILALAFAVLLFFYFQAKVETYSLKVQNQIQSEIIGVYDDMLQSPNELPPSYFELAEKHGELEPVREVLEKLKRLQSE